MPTNCPATKKYKKFTMSAAEETETDKKRASYEPHEGTDEQER